MRAAVSNIAWTPEERLSAYSLLSEADFKGLEIAPRLFFHAAADPFRPDDRVVSKAIAEIADAGLALVSMQSLLFGLPEAHLFGGESARKLFESGMRQAIELAGRLSIPNVVFGSPQQRRVPSDLPMSQALNEATEVFRRLGDLADRAGTKISIEPNPAAYGTNFLTSLEEASLFVKHVNHPAVVSILDLGAMRMNDTYETASSAVPGLLACLNHVHVSEPHLAPAPADVTSLVPVILALDNSGYDKYVSIEMRRPDNGLAGVKAAVSRMVAAFQVKG